jgi:hypothetical protein
MSNPAKNPKYKNETTGAVDRYVVKSFIID